MPIKILFLHGFFASGSCVPAQTLRHSLDGRAQVLSPDLPLHPDEALDFIRHICHEEHPTVIVGNSNGAFLAQMVASEYGMPALLGNPHLEMTEFLNCRRGTHQYKSPRADGRQELVIDQALIDEFAVLQQHQWNRCSEQNRDRVWGLFGDKDTLAHYEPLFLEHYTRSFHFPGAHTPTAEEVEQYYAPLAMKLADEFGGE